MTKDGYKAGQLVGKAGLEKQYEGDLKGREGVQFVEVDAHNRIVPNGRAREDVTPLEGPHAADEHRSRSAGIHAHALRATRSKPAPSR